MSMEAVAAAAGTTTPSLRRRFRGKTELASAVIDALRIEPLLKPTKCRAPMPWPCWRTCGPTWSGRTAWPRWAASWLRRTAPAAAGAVPQRAGRAAPRAAAPGPAGRMGVAQGQLPARLDLDVAVSLLGPATRAIWRLGHHPGRLGRPRAQRHLAARRQPAAGPQRRLAH